MTFNSIISVVADPSEMPEELADCHRPFFPGIIRNISLNFGVEVDFPFLHELQNGDSCYCFRDRSQPVRAFRLCRNAIFEVSAAESFRPGEIILDEPHRKAGNSVESHLLNDKALVGFEGLCIERGSVFLRRESPSEGVCRGEDEQKNKAELESFLHPNSFTFLLLLCSL